METTHTSSYKLSVIVKEHGIYVKSGSRHVSNAPFSMLELLEKAGVPQGEYKVTIRMRHESHEEIGIAVYEVTVETTCVFYAAWHGGEFKNFPGELGGWWGNEVICNLDVTEMLVEHIMVPDNDYNMAIVIETDRR